MKDSSICTTEGQYPISRCAHTYCLLGEQCFSLNSSNSSLIGRDPKNSSCLQELIPVILNDSLIDCAL